MTTESIKIGDKAPNFSIPISNGEVIALKTLQGKFIILYFYPKDDTPGCTIEANDFNELRQEFEENNAMLIGVSKDDLNSHEKFKKKYDLKFSLGSDTEGVVCNQFGVMIEKSMFGKKYMGINRSTFLIDKEGKIAHIWPNVSVQGHAREVLNVLKALK